MRNRFKRLSVELDLNETSFWNVVDSEVDESTVIDYNFEFLEGENLLKKLRSIKISEDISYLKEHDIGTEVVMKTISLLKSEVAPKKKSSINKNSPNNAKDNQSSQIPPVAVKAWSSTGIKSSSSSANNDSLSQEPVQDEDPSKEPPVVGKDLTDQSVAVKDPWNPALVATHHLMKTWSPTRVATPLFLLLGVAATSVPI